MRRAVALVLALAAGPAAAACDHACTEVTGAAFGAPTGRYPHGVLGDALEWGSLTIRHRADGGETRIVLPDARVFEDVAPRVVDLDLDGRDDAVAVVESHRERGARLALYDAAGRVAATPHIGTRFRWLAPAAIADLDGDGAVEIAFVDRPHLARVLRVWRYAGGRLVEVAAVSGVTNHRIGEPFVSGGLRDCGAGPEIVLASADWTRVLAVTFDGAAVAARDLGPWSAPAAERALRCAR